MKLDALVLFRGPDAKSRLGDGRGGPLTDNTRQQLLQALLLDTHQCLAQSSSFADAWIGVDGSEGADFVDSIGLPPLVLPGGGVNSQIQAASRFMAERADGYLLLGADLPFLTPQYLDRLAEEAKAVVARRGRGIVFGISRGLGSSSILSIPSDILPVVLGHGPTFLVNRERLESRRLPYAVVLCVEGYFDLDTADDLSELSALPPDALRAAGAGENFITWLDINRNAIDHFCRQESE